LDQKYIIDDKDLPKMLKNKENELYFLQKKRKLKNLEINNNDFIFQKDNNFSILNGKKIEVNINQQNEIENGQQIIKTPFINFGKKNSKNFEFFKNENLEKNNKIQNLLNGMKNNLVDFSTKKNVNGNIDILSKDQSKESSNNQISHFLEKKNYFIVKQEEKPKKIYKADTLNTENNNEIKVLKNNKVVYINRDLLNSYSSLRNIKEVNNTFFVERNKRTSKYRGVSKNGYQWQVLMMVNNNKYYLGSYPSEELAARIYDVLAIKNRGAKAKTNFVYNKNQIKKINENEIDIKSENISEIIEQLIN
jgi:hypothetical protein